MRFGVSIYGVTSWVFPALLMLEIVLHIKVTYNCGIKIKTIKFFSGILNYCSRLRKQDVIHLFVIYICLLL